MTVGEQAMNIGRNAALAAGFPESVPGTTVDRQCGSAQQAIHFAAQAVMSGAMDIAIGAGIESMTRVPIGSTTDPGPGEAYGPDRPRPLPVHPPGPLGRGDRRALEGDPAAQMDAFALESHRRAALAQDEGRFANEIIPLTAPGPTADPDAVLDFDEGVRRGSTIEKLAALRPAFAEDGTDHGGLVVADLRRGGGRARHVRGAGRVLWGCGPGPASTPSPWPPTIPSSCSPPSSRPPHLVLEKAKLKLSDMDVIEINEAFASVVLAWESEFHRTWRR